MTRGGGGSSGDYRCGNVDIAAAPSSLFACLPAGRSEYRRGGYTSSKLLGSLAISTLHLIDFVYSYFFVFRSFMYEGSCIRKKNL